MEDFLSSEFPPAPREKARFHVIPVPYERSVSYGAGTAEGPAAILESSSQLEKIQRGRKPGALGIHTAPAVDCGQAPEAVMRDIEKAVLGALDCRALPFLLGGEHTVTLGAARALCARYGTDWGLVQFDAHCDLRYAYEGNQLSHASVMRRVSELGIPICQFGTRSYCEEEQAYRQDPKNRVTYYDGERLYLLNREGGLKDLLPESFPKRVYVSFDIDGLDAALMPATGTPVPGGIGWYEALAILEDVLRGREAAGLDLVEYAPIRGFQAYDFTAATLAYEMMALAVREQRG